MVGTRRGHVNLFSDPCELAAIISSSTEMSYYATKVLTTSLCFLNRNNIKSRMPVRMVCVFFGAEWFVRGVVYLFRQIDHLFGLKLSRYGWALYFGMSLPIDHAVWTNVCIRCGAGHPDHVLRSTNAIRRRRLLPDWYNCPSCGTKNLYTEDAVGHN